MVSSWRHRPARPLSTSTLVLEAPLAGLDRFLLTHSLLEVEKQNRVIYVHDFVEGLILQHLESFPAGPNEGRL